MGSTSGSQACWSIEVLYSGLLQQTLNLSRERVSVASGAKVFELLLLLADKHGEALREAMFVGEGKLVPNALVLVDGRDTRHKQGLQTPLAAGSVVEVLVLPPATGGG